MRSAATGPLTLLFLVLGVTTMAQVVSDPGNPFNRFNRLVYDARGNDPVAVQTMLDELMETFAGTTLPASGTLRDRIFRGEMAFRTGKSPAILEQRVAAATNDLVSAARGPAWARTSDRQLHLFRALTKPNIPQLIGLRQSARRPIDFSDQMSPAEAILISANLLYNKFFDTRYQVPPEQWVTEILANRRRPSRKEEAEFDESFGRVLKVPREIYTMRDGLTSGLADDRSAVTAHVGAFLTQIGIGR